MNQLITDQQHLSAKQSLWATFNKIQTQSLTEKEADLTSTATTLTYRGLKYVRHRWVFTITEAQIRSLPQRNIKRFRRSDSTAPKALPDSKLLFTMPTTHSNERQLTAPQIKSLLLELKAQAAKLAVRSSPEMREAFKQPERLDQTFNSLGGF